ncbi:hypothetical protein [Stenotrophomonas sepilia]
MRSVPAQRLLPLAGLVLLALLGVGVYWNGLNGGFIFDDFPNLVDDPDWRLTSLDFTSIAQVMGNGVTGDVGRPLALLSFGLNYYFTGLAPWPMKVTGLALHLLNSMLVFALASGLIGRVLSMSSSQVRLTAFMVATAWMVHPLQVSTVLYVVQRMEMGGATGALIALLCYLKARSSVPCSRAALFWWCGAVVGAGIGLAFKETAILIPVYTLLIEVFLLKFRNPDGTRARALSVLYAFGATGAALLYFAVILPGALVPERYSARDFSLAGRLYSQPAILLNYLQQIMLPWPESLKFYYDNAQVPPSWRSTVFIVPMLALVALLTAAWGVRKRWPLTALGIGWFFASHLLTSNVVPLELAFEHRNYLAIAGVALALVQPLGALMQRWTVEARRTVGGVLLLFVAAMGWIQVQTWADPMRLALTLSNRNPDSSRAGYELGRALLASAPADPASPAWALAEKEFTHAASLPGSSPLPEQALIILKSNQGRAQLPEVWAALERKISRRSLGPQEVGALEAIVACRVEGGCRPAEEQVLFALLSTATAENPRSSRVRVVFSNYAFNVMRDPDLAMRLIREAVQISPKDLGCRLWLLRMGLASNLLQVSEARQGLGILRAVNHRHAYDRDIEGLEHWLVASQQTTGE